MSDRPIGCLLSGGLDSSLITSIVSRLYRELGHTDKLRTFSVGLEGSTDLRYARMVADYLDTNHTELILTEEDMLAAIPEVIKMTETYDTTTVRASTPMYLLCKHIKETTDITVLFSGEGSDEASGSYLYFHNAPSVDEFHKETMRLLKDLSYFDVLRCDKSTAGAGLEVRVPFLDRDFLDFYMSIPPRMKIPSYSYIEKYLLRKAFDTEEDKYGLYYTKGYLPYDVLWRQKEGMSDGVSSKTRGWFQVIQEHVQKLDSEGLIPSVNYTHNPPLIKESEWYRQIYNQLYPGCDELIPYYWLPRWCGDVKDPSARVLKVYKQDD
jgi:asparagine synthase (glutamine-hydrolysing)